jgi:vacuole morphology and inheritance protein 14
MGDTISPLSASVLRNLADKLYEKRKIAALEIEGVVKSYTAAQDHEKISSLISFLIDDFAMSPQANYRKGGLLALAAATVGLASEASPHLEVKPHIIGLQFLCMVFCCRFRRSH